MQPSVAMHQAERRDELLPPTISEEEWRCARPAVPVVLFVTGWSSHASCAMSRRVDARGISADGVVASGRRRATRSNLKKVLADVSLCNCSIFLHHSATILPTRRLSFFYAFPIFD